jgi:uncharacterized membrane protein HdeD (DUF308 family)
MSNAPPWKVVFIAALAIAAGVKLLVTPWSLGGLSLFAGMAFVALGALQIVTMSFVGLPGALSALGGGGEMAVGASILAWPAPTLLVLALFAGSWIVVRGVVDATILVATRPDRPRWFPLFMGVLMQLALGVVLLLRPGGSVRGASVILGVSAVLAGVLEISGAVGRERWERRLRSEAPARSVAVAS